MKGNHDAIAKEIASIARVFDVEKADARLVDAAFQEVKMTSESRAWPTAAMVFDAVKAVKRRESGEVAPGNQKGNRLTLSRFDADKLGLEVIPTAKRWLREFPGLRGHAIALLEYWGEELRDDRGNAYTSPRAKVEE